MGGLRSEVQADYFTPVANRTAKRTMVIQRSVIKHSRVEFCRGVSTIGAQRSARIRAGIAISEGSPVPASRPTADGITQRIKHFASAVRLRHRRNPGRPVHRLFTRKFDAAESGVAILTVQSKPCYRELVPNDSQ